MNRVVLTAKRVCCQNARAGSKGFTKQIRHIPHVNSNSPCRSFIKGCGALLVDGRYFKRLFLAAAACLLEVWWVLEGVDQHDATTMDLRWHPSPGAYLVDADPDDNFDIKLTHVVERKKNVLDINLNVAVFEVLQLKISMRRKMSYHLIQTYIPSAFLVFITWLTFLIPENLIEARIGISMTTLLTLTAMFSAVREHTPTVSYVKAIDIWMVYCIFTVFSTLLEFTFFVWLRNYKVAKREKKLKFLMSDGNEGASKNRNPLLKSFLGKKTARSNVNRRHSIEEFSTKATEAFERTAVLLNRFAFGFFVFNFLVFNSIYWPWLMIKSEYFKWEVNNTLNGDMNNKHGGFLDEL